MFDEGTRRNLFALTTETVKGKFGSETSKHHHFFFFFCTFKEEETLYLTIDRRSMLSKKQVASVSLLLHFNNAFKAYVMREF